MVGMLAISLAGHDKDQIYVIIKEEEEYVWLSEGRLKPLEKPKRKNKKHIQIINKYQDPEIIRKLQNGLSLYNEEIKHIVKIKKQEELL